MNWHNASDFLAMGGYGRYVWGAFGMTAVALALEIWQNAARRRALRGGDAP